MTPLVLSLCLVCTAQPPEPVLPPPVPVPVVPAPPPTLEQFTKSFTPQAGIFEVTVIHPCSGKPVNFAFKLPEGCPKVSCGRRTLEFDYGKCNVEIVFRIGGRVGVEYRN